MSRKNNLIIRINETSVSITEVFHLDHNEQSIGQHKIHVLQSNISDQRKIELKECLASFKNNNYNAVFVFWNSAEQFIVPMRVFQASNLKDIAKLILGDVDANELDYNRLPEYDKVVIFRIPVWVKSAIVVSFPLSEIRAETSVFARCILRNIKVKAQLHLKISGGCASYFITGTGAKASDEILFMNHYMVENENDILYFLLNLIQNTKTDLNDVFVYFQQHNEGVFTKEQFQIKVNEIHDLKSLIFNYKSEEELINLFSICV
jgi:hypothetical protein